MYGVDYQVTKSGEQEGHVVNNSDNIFGSAFSSPTGTIQNPDFKFITFEKPNFSSIIPVCSLFRNPSFSTFYHYFLVKKFETLVWGFRKKSMG